MGRERMFSGKLSVHICHCWKWRTRQRTSSVASVRLCCGAPCVWSCISQSLREAPAVGSTAPHWRATVVYLPSPPWTAVNKWGWNNSQGSIGNTHAGICWRWARFSATFISPHTTFVLLSRVDVSFTQLLCHKFPSVLIHVAVIESFLINL